MSCLTGNLSNHQRMKDFPHSLPPPRPSFLSSLQLRLQPRRRNKKLPHRCSSMRAWLLGIAVGARLALLGCLGVGGGASWVWPELGSAPRAHPTLGSPPHALQARLTSFPGACHKLGRAPARRKARGSGPLNPCLPHPPLPQPNSLFVSARPGQGAIWPSCFPAGLCPAKGRRGLYPMVAPVRGRPLKLVGVGPWRLLVTDVRPWAGWPVPGRVRM